MSDDLDPVALDAIAYGIAKLFHTPIDQLAAEAAEHRASQSSREGGSHATTVGASAREMLRRFDHLVALHETFWSRVAQERPTEMHAFLRHSWDPWFAWWGQTRPHLGPDQRVVGVLHEAARGLSGLREFAAYNGIPTPDLGTSQHGIVQPSQPGEPPMVSQNSQAPHMGADPIEGYRGIAIDAVRSAHHQDPSISVFGYVRTGRHQKVYLFHAADQANAWHAQLQPGYDYAVVFTAADQHYAPVTEDFAAVTVTGQLPHDGGDAQVGHWLLPLALGVPAGAAGGYFYRKWQEKHPGKLIPWIGAAPDDVARRHAWPRTRALIQSAISETALNAHLYPQSFFVWSLESDGSAHVVPFASHDEALAHMRDRIQTDHVALALFDQTSPHWPNPVGWNKSDGSPEHEAVIVQQIAKYAHHDFMPRRESAHAQVMQQPTAAAGAMYPYFDMVLAGDQVGGPWIDLIGAAIDVFRKQAQAAAQVAPGPVVGMRRDASGQWRIEQFHSADDADDWFGHATHDPSHFTYAAYFDKRDPTFPEPLNEAIGGARGASAPGPAIRRGVAEVSGCVGAAPAVHVRPDYRARAVAAATTKQHEAPAPFYVYLRSPHYEVTWPFTTLEEANAYGASQVDNPRGIIDYMALFAATDRAWPHPVYEWSDRAAEMAA